MTVAEALGPTSVPLASAPVPSETSRTAFRYANRFSIVPLHQAGLGAWFGSPLIGCQLLLTTKGRKSGLPRPTPLGYLVAEGAIWVMAGYGPSTLWYRNLLAEPRVEVLLPARPPMPATAADVTDPAVRARILPALVQSMALPGRALGVDPLKASDEQLLELSNWVPLIAIRPDGPAVVAGPDDPGGYGWVWRMTVMTVVSWLSLRAIWRCLRG